MSSRSVSSSLDFRPNICVRDGQNAQSGSRPSAENNLRHACAPVCDKCGWLLCRLQPAQSASRHAQGCGRQQRRSTSRTHSSRLSLIKNFVLRSVRITPDILPSVGRPSNLHQQQNLSRSTDILFNVATVSERRQTDATATYASLGA